MLLLSRRKWAKELENVVVKLNEKKVERSEKVKLLGVWIDEGLTWKAHIEAVRRKCFGGLAKLRRLWDALPAVTKKTSITPWCSPLLITVVLSGKSAVNCCNKESSEYRTMG